LVAGTPQEDIAMIIGVTGHQHLQDPTKWAWVEHQIRSVVNVTKDLIGVTSLAVGADSLFANIVLECGGKLYVVIPFQEYALEFTENEDGIKYKQLLAMADKIEIRKALGSKEQAYYDAGKHLVNISESIIAVWDGKPAAGLGGTGDIVKYTKQSGKIVYHINPETGVAKYI